LINICIHGHFYQPPRENPWTGEIERQHSATPYHDWNERIYEECYKPNSYADIINDKGETVLEVNNYEYINFNFGPALLAWIQNKHPETYQKIINADKRSISLHGGHGNAIAMCYNHMIMPLANFNDKITQVKWGLADFRHHFGRESEGIWLPETACNIETIEVLINEGVKYIILDTSQAEQVRKFEDVSWTDVSENTIDPKMPYRYYSEVNRDKYLDIFFYNGPVSKAVAFDDVLKSSQNLLNKIVTASDKDTTANQLVSIATDGETFGHHKKHAERTLAFFIRSLAPQNNLKMVNYGQYLEDHQPNSEVKLKPGKNGLGTSWSCVHGIERWRDDCGCGGGGGWHQMWRAPLKETLDWLRDSLVVIYENIGSLFFKDVWKARNDYIELLLDTNSAKEDNFFTDNAVRKLNKTEITMAIKLLEMQRNAMLMYTSCGWFFSEISGLETVKILEYASMAMDITKEITGVSFEAEFKNKLKEAPSNIPKYENGSKVFDELVLKNKRSAGSL
jgi:alpha-amylase/alpha-mannosidase (GH57 family)